MARKLASTVHVVDDNGAAHVFGPGDEVPSWAEKKITNESAWEDDGQDDDGTPDVNSLSAAQPLEEQAQPAEPAPEDNNQAQQGSRRRRGGE